MDSYKEIRKGERGAWISIIAYLSLSLLKLFAGAAAGSEALLADGLNNATDIIASCAVLIGLRISRKPPDRNHRYGHFRAETVSSLVASLIMMAVGIEVLFSSVRKFAEPAIGTPDMIAAWTALFCAAVMFAVYRINLRIAKKINSAALTAAAADNRSDALVSIGAFAGVIGSRLGWPWLDPLTAGIVGLIICKTAWDIFIDASHALTDGFDPAELEKIKQTVKETPGVLSIKDIKARVHGNNVFVDVVVDVHGNLSVVESHAITEQIEERVSSKHQITHVHVHIEPYEKTAR
mgnify:CR=1 FL=1